MIKNSSHVLFKLIFCIILLSTILNISRKLDRVNVFFDDWSESVVFSSLLYKIDTNKLTGIPRVLTIYTLDGETHKVTDRHAFHRDVILLDKYTPSPDNQYALYTSNINIQATLLATLLLEPLYKMGMPLSSIINIVKFFSVFMFSIVITLFMFSLRSYFSGITFLILAVLIGVFSTHINLTAKSFYWSIWLYFVPYLAQYALMRSNLYQKSSVNKRLLYISLIAFGTMTLFFLFHLETFSGSVIGMFLPYILEFTKNTKIIKTTIKQILAIIIGSFCAFVFVVVLKLLLVSHYLGWAEALSRQGGNLLFRLVPDGNLLGTLQYVAASLLKNVYFSLWNIIKIQGKDIFIFNILMYFISTGIMKYYPTIKNRVRDLLVIHFVLLLAAGSWFILALPHAAVHIAHLQFLVTLFYVIPTSLVIIEIVKILWFDRFLPNK